MHEKAEANFFSFTTRKASEQFDTNVQITLLEANRLHSVAINVDNCFGNMTVSAAAMLPENTDDFTDLTLEALDQIEDPSYRLWLINEINDFNDAQIEKIFAPKITMQIANWADFLQMINQ
jgi:hypothetical protein